MHFASGQRIAMSTWPFSFTGASGLGRTTFINTLCDADVVPKRECDEPEMAHIEEGIKIKPYSVGK